MRTSGNSYLKSILSQTQMRHQMIMDYRSSQPNPDPHLCHSSSHPGSSLYRNLACSRRRRFAGLFVSGNASTNDSYPCKPFPPLGSIASNRGCGSLWGNSGSWSWGRSSTSFVLDFRRVRRPRYSLGMKGQLKWPLRPQEQAVSLTIYKSYSYY